MANVSRLMNLASDKLKIWTMVDMNTERCTTAFGVLVKELSNAENIANAIKTDDIQPS